MQIHKYREMHIFTLYKKAIVQLVAVTRHNIIGLKHTALTAKILITLLFFC